MKTAISNLKYFALFLIMSSLAHAQVSEVESSARTVARQYFNAFAAHDADRIGALYQDATAGIFEDAIFTPALNTNEARMMWKILFRNPQNYSVSYEIRRVTGDTVFALWTARYNYSLKNRRVVNQGTTVLKVQNGKIVMQRDYFDVCRWFNMALPADQSTPLCFNPTPFRALLRKTVLDALGPQSQSNE